MKDYLVKTEKASLHLIKINQWEELLIQELENYFIKGMADYYCRKIEERDLKELRKVARTPEQELMEALCERVKSQYELK